jgi:ribosome-associated toxin RatA of RatAB toxin-antitoxin module
MNLLRHSIQMKTTDIDTVFQTCVDVENWHKIFPRCVKATVLKLENNEQLIEITGNINDTIITWQSVRPIDYASRTIGFRQVKPMPLLKNMEGAWRFYTLENSILVSIEHRFEVKDNIKGLTEGVNTREEAIAYIEKMIRINCSEELRLLKEYVEKMPAKTAVA